MDPPLLRLPQELMNMVWNELDDASRGSLALTCKAAYEYWKPIFDHPVFRESSRQTYKIDNYDGQSTQRGYRAMLGRAEGLEYWQGKTRFMQQIQPENYIYCQSCGKIHPQSEFEQSELEKATDDKHCRWPGLFSGVFDCFVLPANTEDPREVLVNIDYVFCLSKEIFVPNPQIDIRICPHISLFGLVFRDRVLEKKEVESSVQYTQCNATAKVTPERLGADAIQY